MHILTFNTMKAPTPQIVSLFKNVTLTERPAIHIMLIRSLSLRLHSKHEMAINVNENASSWQDRICPAYQLTI